MPPVRAILDANVLISYLLPSGREQTIPTIVEAALSGGFRLLMPDELGDEVRRAVRTKEYLRRRIRSDHVETMIAELWSVAELLAPLGSPIPETTRDPKDDYLIAYAVVNQADYLVTRDRDLLGLGKIADLKIVSPAEFARLLEPSAQP